MSALPLADFELVEGHRFLDLGRDGGRLSEPVRLVAPYPLMGWSGRALAPPASEAGKGRQRQGARHATQAQFWDRRDRSDAASSQSHVRITHDCVAKILLD